MKVIDSFKGEYSFLSNFFHSPFSIYNTVEHYFQAHKTKTLSERFQIALAKTPGEAKKLGRKCQLRDDWDQIKNEVMQKGLLYKFINTDLTKALIKTDCDILIEGNYWHDNYWGDCYCPKCKSIEGKNTLGILLMELREKFKKGEYHNG
jgi:ribA/ribD-fused uncharacterized protein